MGLETIHVQMYCVKAFGGEEEEEKKKMGETHRQAECQK